MEIYHEVLVNLLRPDHDFAQPEKLYDEGRKIVEMIEEVISALRSRLPPGWSLEVEE